VDTVQQSQPLDVADNLYLSGSMAPVTEEVTAFDLPVTGTLPAELDGRYLRNGPNPVAPDPATYHWFTGEGMVHGVRLRDGRAEWYRNRWTMAPGAEFPPNTNVIGISGRTFAIVEAGASPVELTDELEPIAANRFDGTLAGAFTAHPKVDPATGLLHAMTYWWPEESVHYVVVGPDARVQHDAEIPVGDRPMVHDIAITETRALLFDLPVTFDLELASSGARLPYVWRPERAARVGVLPLHGNAADVVWCDVPQCYVYHPLNAYDLPDGRIVVDLVRWPKTFDVDDRQGPGVLATRLERWTVDPSTGRVTTDVLDDRSQELPRINEGLVGRPHRYGYAMSWRLGEVAGGIYKHDVVAGTSEAWDPGPTRWAGEAVFVPRDGATGEDDGWLLTYVYDAAEATSDLVVLAADDLASGPVASVHLPQRVPAGFHGNWVPAAS
jgi:carotenoid cleavage dioxygenase-like enzyme